MVGNALENSIALKADLTREPETAAGSFVELMYNISNLPQVTIGAVDGRARGAGNELLMGLDMRFATKYETLLGQIEVATGLIPGGGGSQHLPGLIGRGLAMEYILSGKDINAQDAERIGWINKLSTHRVRCTPTLTSSPRAWFYTLLQR